ncbi:MAG: YqgE/AlgH family protein [Polyangiales bacterium]
MRCPFFNHTLVLLIDHGDEGSFGFVVNRMTDVDIEDVFNEVGVTGEAAGTVRTPVMLGGPVSPESGWILYAVEGVPVPPSGRTIAVGEGIACSASLDLLERIARGDGPDTCAMMLGYSGWGAGQLESEMKLGSWIPVDLDYGLVFDTPIENRWEAALGKLGIDPAHFIDNQIASA